MSAATPIYKRLTRSAAGLSTYSSLWLAADHLLIVKSTGYSESYSRIQFKDIKGVFLTRTARRLYWGFVWGMPMLGGLLGVLTTGAGSFPVTSLVFLLLGLGAFVWNYLMGPGCKAYILTGVQTAPLPALVRLKKARRALQQIQPLIEAAQVDLVPPLPPVQTPTTAAQPEPPPAVA